MQALILHSQDWAFFSAWSDFVDLAAEAGAVALLVVNLDEAVYTLQDVSNYTAPVPVWNMDCNCGAALSYFAAQGKPFITNPSSCHVVCACLIRFVVSCLSEVACINCHRYQLGAFLNFCSMFVITQPSEPTQDSEARQMS